MEFVMLFLLEIKHHMDMENTCFLKGLAFRLEPLLFVEMGNVALGIEGNGLDPSHMAEADGLLDHGSADTLVSIVGMGRDTTEFGVMIIHQNAHDPTDFLLMKGN